MILCEMVEVEINFQNIFLNCKKKNQKHEHNNKKRNWKRVGNTEK
jgi:hypothetical protein